MKVVPLAQPPSSNIVPIVEDYSDVAEEDDQQLQEKVADFKVIETHNRIMVFLKFAIDEEFHSAGAFPSG